MLYSFVRGIILSFYKVVFFEKSEGFENIPSGGFIICANHHSNWDPVTIFAVFKRKLTFMAKEELFKIPVLRTIIKKFGAYPIRRGRATVSSIKTAISVTKNGGVTLIFPEGRRVKRGEKVEVKSSIVRIANQTGVPLLPVTIKGKYTPFSRIKVIVHEPIYCQDAENEEKITKTLMDEIYKSID